MKKKQVSLIFFIAVSVLPVSSVAQVSNDQIENRLELKLNQSVPSNTTDCTVQWNCVDERLTGKCIEYHNDQWFFFQVENIGNYYINIYNQKCKDLLGIQLVVIDGIPCETNSYEILDCVSLETQNDFFIELSTLKQDHTYLLNVDGYLKDFCGFEIELSDSPRGIPVKDFDVDLKVSTSRLNELHSIEWEISESIASDGLTFSLLRRAEKETKFKNIGRVPLQKNSRGETQLKYTNIDTVEYGKYYYKILLNTINDEILTIYEFAEHIDNIPTKSRNFITLNLDYEQGDSLSLLIFNAYTDSLIDTINFNYDQNVHNKMRYDVDPLIRKGIERLWIEVVNHKKKTEKSFLVQLELK
ncbi:hypothetical protein QQ008_03780 [Fulvivirgaceae bacterium BMA10]|uniref:Uncharacterized protein n=1 Tax=Splendidivirga corallicola TaxID=3051826 RepID=A0ABT8KJM4_9BACT|nr:hypothetical protein [Fulvivirgaceae bacterium BMA10]